MQKSKKIRIKIFSVLLLIIVITFQVRLVNANSSGAARFTPYCAASLTPFSDEALLSMHIVPDYDEDCVCFQRDSFTPWEDVYCIPEHGGKMMQERIRTYYVPPNCIHTAWEYQYQTVARDYCRICNAPIILNDWHDIGCGGGKKIMQRELLVEIFTPTVGKCVKKNYREIKNEASDICVVEQSIINIGDSLLKIWYVPVLVVLVYLFLRRKKRR